MRRFGDWPSADQKFIVRPGAYGVLLRGQSVLLTHQADDESEPFQLPGGGIDPGESPLVALRREILEETGWTIGAPRKAGMFRRYVFMPEYGFWAEKIYHIFLARPARKVMEPSEPFHSALWATPDMAFEMIGSDADRSFSTHALSLVFK